MKKIGLLIALFAMTVGFAFAQNDAPVTGASKLVVKGLYIGMTLDEAAAVIKPKLPEGFSIITGPFKVNKGPMADGFPMANEDDSYLSFGDRDGVVLADSSQKIKEIYFWGVLTDGLFNVKDMSCPDFVKQFAKAYNIPSFKAYQNEDTSAWKYLSPENCEVTITCTRGVIGKDISIIQRPPPKVVTPDFN